MFKTKSLFLLIAVACASMFTWLTPVHAANTTSGDTQINYTVAEQYTWTAPASITFTQNINTESKTGTLSVKKNIIASNKKLQIKIDPNEDFLLKDSSDATNTRTYVVKKGSTTIAKGGVVLEVAAGTNTGSADLTFVLQSITVEKAGTYTGTANFVSSVVSVS